MSPELEVRAKLPQIARQIKEALPPCWGLALMVFPFDGREGNLNYISTAKREDVVKVLRDFLERVEADKAAFGTHQDG
jgi:hypothetical protein